MSHTEHTRIRKDFRSEALKEAVLEPVWLSGIWDKTVRRLEAIRTVSDLLEQQRDGEAASPEEDENRQEKVASA